jgi:hypothetical protein
VNTISRQYVPRAADEIRYLKSIIGTIKLGKKQGLRQLLADCHGRKATGERETVFALLSLTEGTSPRDWNIG